MSHVTAHLRTTAAGAVVPVRPHQRRSTPRRTALAVVADLADAPTSEAPVPDPAAVQRAVAIERVVTCELGHCQAVAESDPTDLPAQAQLAADSHHIAHQRIAAVTTDTGTAAMLEDAYWRLNDAERRLGLPSERRLGIDAPAVAALDRDTAIADIAEHEADYALTIANRAYAATITALDVAEDHPSRKNAVRSLAAASLARTYGQHAVLGTRQRLQDPDRYDPTISSAQHHRARLLLEQIRDHGPRVLAVGERYALETFRLERPRPA